MEVPLIFIPSKARNHHEDIATPRKKTNATYLVSLGGVPVDDSQCVWEGQASRLTVPQSQHITQGQSCGLPSSL